MIRYGGWFWLAFLFALPIVAFGWALFLAIVALGIIAVAITGRVVQPSGRHRPVRHVAPEPATAALACNYCGYRFPNGSSVMDLLGHVVRGCGDE